MLEHELAAVIQKRGGWYVAYVEEIPGGNTQGCTLAEARRNLRKAFRLIRSANRKLTRRGSTANTSHCDLFSRLRFARAEQGQILGDRSVLQAVAEPVEIRLPHGRIGFGLW
jgi:hypothetical protein